MNRRGVLGRMVAGRVGEKARVLLVAAGAYRGAWGMVCWDWEVIWLLGLGARFISDNRGYRRLFLFGFFSKVKMIWGFDRKRFPALLT
jgi:hypothetical protein